MPDINYHTAPVKPVIDQLEATKNAVRLGKILQHEPYVEVGMKDCAGYGCLSYDADEQTYKVKRKRVGFKEEADSFEDGMKALDWMLGI